MRVLALDVGSSSVRALVFDEAGTAAGEAEARVGYEVAHRRGGRAELDADALVDATKAVLDEAARKGGAVDAVAASAFWHSLIAVDRAGSALTPVMTWLDGRAAREARRLRGRLDARSVHARTGCPLHSSYWPAKLAWLAEESRDVFRSADRFLSFSDYLFLRVTGDSRTTGSMASGTGLLDVHAGRWDEELLDELGLAPERLPEISDDVVEREIPWFRAWGDGGCANVGVGCVTPERAALTIGTSGAYRVVRYASAPPADGLFLYRLDDRRFVEGGAVSDGGRLFAWLRRTLREVDPRSLAGREPDGHGLTFLPLLGGERSPGWTLDASGAIAGLSFETTPHDVLQAALEGVCYRFAEIAERLPQVREVVAGGRALLADPDWIQLLADVLERPIAASGVPEASARGAAVLALERLGRQPGEAPLGRVYEPRRERSEAYRAARARQRELYRRLVG